MSGCFHQLIIKKLKMKTSNKNGTLISLLVVGTVVGAALGYLFATNTGSKTRKKLISQAKGLAYEFNNSDKP